VCVCVCVCVIERDRERECVCVIERDRERECVYLSLSLYVTFSLSHTTMLRLWVFNVCVWANERERGESACVTPSPSLRVFVSPFLSIDKGNR